MILRVPQNTILRVRLSGSVWSVLGPYGPRYENPPTFALFNMPKPVVFRAKGVQIVIWAGDAAK